MIRQIPEVVLITYIPPDSFGNSYQPQVADDMFRVKRILGEKSEKGSYEGTSMRESEITKPENKIIQGDWNWPYDREDTWHAKDGEARHIMLYADGHAREFVFPPTEQMLKWITPPPHGEMPNQIRIIFGGRFIIGHALQGLCGSVAWCGGVTSRG